MTRPTWIDSERRLARRVGRPLQDFVRIEASGGVVLLAAAVVALAWANSPWQDGYERFLATEVVVEVGGFRLAEDLRHWVNDGLMALFFLVVGVEIKREWVTGELQDRRAAALPALAALGGMVVPALLYTAWNVGGEGARGWGIPMATDIAFALGVVALLGRRVPSSLKVFLLTLAIVDDIGAILVIAVFYSGSLSWGWLTAAAAALVAVVLLRRAQVRYQPPFVVLGFVLWLCVFESGVHATIAGVAMGLLTPARPFQPSVDSERIVDRLEDRPDLEAADVRDVSFLIRESVPVTERVGHALHPWVTYGVVPLFALANAGVQLSGDVFEGGTRVALGVVVGLVAGKIVGVGGFAWLAVRTGAGRMPNGASWSQLVGVAALAGIGFTVSLFVAGLAFPDGQLLQQAKIGILAASMLAAFVGTALLWNRPRGGAASRTGV